MKKTLSRLLAIAMTASLVLSGCGGTGGSTSTEEGTSTEGNTTSTEGNTTSTEGEATAEAGSENEIKDLVLGILSSRELETFNILQSQRAEDFENLTQLVDGLLEADPDGKLVPAIADEWGTEDGGLTWKFHIRDGVKWVDVNGNEKGDCDADRGVQDDRILRHHAVKNLDCEYRFQGPPGSAYGVSHMPR